MLGLILLVMVALWAALTLLIGWFWRGVRKKSGGQWNFGSIAATVIAILWLAGSFWYGGGAKIYYDAKVDRLCAVDGGVKVYETVSLPPEKFNEGGYPNFFRPTQNENALGPEYIFKWERTYLRNGNPDIIRTHHEVIRRADSKLLGETTYYERGGGDLPIPGAPSSYICPSIDDSGVGSLFKQVFINSTM